MKRGVNLRSFDSLKELEEALAHFAGRAREAMHALERDARQTAEELEGRWRDGERRMRHWQQAYEEARNEEERRYAAHKLEEAEEYLRRTYHLRKLLTERQQQYGRQAEKLKELAGDVTVRARHFLKESVEQLQAYTMVQSSGLALGSPAEKPSFNSTGAGTETGKSALSGYPLPDGYRWVPLDEINLAEIPEDLAFGKTAREEMRYGFGTLEADVLPALKEDLARGSSYFGERDRDSGRDYQDGEQRVYDAFFGHDHIRLERWEGEPQYSITNGRHRIAVARELGWAEIPASTSDVPRKA
ncbi:MAG: hypothetical protein SCK29_12935 [Bacillota bacterium]|nr:hypothetical protein [Bacillota bacterium]MDW7685005.1 hypothetical protein [Bacillota bacterium]